MKIDNQNPAQPTGFDLSRFLAAQEGVYEQALREMRQGRKESHWMWFIFPQLEGLGRSATAQHYAIKCLNEARAYLAHHVLGPRLLQCCRAILAIDGRSAADIFGYPDDLKLNSSMTLFSCASGSHREFREVIDKYFDGRQDQSTIRLLEGQQ